jgi:hypothetical protein
MLRLRNRPYRNGNSVFRKRLLIQGVARPKAPLVLAVVLCASGIYLSLQGWVLATLGGSLYYVVSSSALTAAGVLRMLLEELVVRGTT